MNNLRRIRREQGLALWGITARSGVSATLLSAIERHGYKPGTRVQQRIAKTLGVPVSAIWPQMAESTDTAREPVTA